MGRSDVEILGGCRPIDDGTRLPGPADGRQERRSYGQHDFIGNSRCLPCIGTATDAQAYLLRL